MKSVCRVRYRIVGAMLTLSFVLVGWSPNAAAQEPSVDSITMVCEYLLDQFQSSMKSELIDAMTDGGPVNAVRVCNVAAVEIARNFSQNEGWFIGRVTDRPRNPNNAPDAYEQLGLIALVRTDGQHYRSWEGELANGTKQFRYLRPIYISGMCVNCHGAKSSMTDSLRVLIDHFYPNDQGHGYSVGDFRGAFTLKIDWPSGKPTYDSLMNLAVASASR